MLISLSFLPLLEGDEQDKNERIRGDATLLRAFEFAALCICVETALAPQVASFEAIPLQLAY